MANKARRSSQTQAKKPVAKKPVMENCADYGPEIELVGHSTPLNVEEQKPVKSSLKVCSLTKLKTLTSSIHLNKELESLCDLTVMDWPYYGKIKAIFAPLFNLRSLRRALKDNDVLHIQYDIAGYMPLFLPILWLLSPFKRAKIVMTLHEKYDNVPLAGLVIAFHNLWYRQADALFVHTQEHKNFLAPYLHTRTHVVPHGVIEAPGVKHQFNSDTILLAGYVNAWKGHDLAVKAMPFVLKEIPTAKLLVLSRSNDMEYEDAVKKTIEELHLKDSVEWNDKRIEESEMFAFFDKSAISLLPYRRITMSGILSHTLSRGVPAVMSDLPPFIEVTKGKAVYFKSRDHEDLAKRLIGLLKDKTLQKRMNADFIALAKEYSWSRMAIMTMKVYGDIARR